MPPPADRQLGRLANFDSFPLAHKFQNDRGECLTVLRANRQTMGARARQQWRYGNYRIHPSRASHLATLGDYGVIESRSRGFRRRLFKRGRSVDKSGEKGSKEKRAILPVTGGALARSGHVHSRAGRLLSRRTDASQRSRKSSGTRRKKDGA